ncbi:MAG: hypothetical protein J7K98_00855 [Candidatus Aenigmarchaeota archaeon]|nr:hypothetical protein [Candidatus Aenigmarchaeota archaeon]
MILNTNQIIILLVIIGLIVAFWVILNKNIIDFHFIMKEFHGRNEAIVFSNVLLSRKEFIHENGERMRAVFDSQKLNSLNGKKITEFGYPNAYVSVVIEDIENGKHWSFYFESLDMPEEKKSKVVECYLKLLQPLTLGGALFTNIWDQYECIANELKKGTYLDVYPVAISYGDEVHLGKMYVTFTQVF